MARGAPPELPEPLKHPALGKLVEEKTRARAASRRARAMTPATREMERPRLTRGTDEPLRAVLTP